MEKQLRNIITIAEDRCNGCGLCIEHCRHEALEIREGKAVLLSESACNGLGSCVTFCPEKALALVRRVAYPHPAAAALATAAREAALARQHGAPSAPRLIPPIAKDTPSASEAVSVTAADIETVQDGCGPCRHWPLKIRLAPVDDPQLAGSHILAAGDCTAFACPDFHRLVNPGKVTLIGCPKFENPKELTEKITEIFRIARPESCTIARMEKPCCKGLVTICSDAAKAAGFDGPLQDIVIHCKGGLGPQ
ncbi:4Fe-4S binding protein [Desulfovibrio sp. OttesenSCG-928-M16]|nr:4Fe-4S binding protein [Desulfovibrio sp. OttesenSCG-928-M16]